MIWREGQWFSLPKSLILLQASKMKMCDCPKCDGNWYMDVDEQGLPYTCFVCGNSGLVTQLKYNAYLDIRHPNDVYDEYANWRAA